MAERLQLSRTRHRLAGGTFLCLLGGLASAHGLVWLGLAVPFGVDELGLTLGTGLGNLALGTLMLVFGIKIRRRKLARRRAQEQRLREIDERLRSLDVAVGPTGLSLRW